MVDYIRADTLNLLHVAAVGPLLWYSHDIDIEIMRGIAVLMGGYHLYRYYQKQQRGVYAVGRPLGLA